MALQGGLDRWFGTVARYTGYALILYAVFIDRFRTPALLPVATGLMVFKNVIGAGK